MEEKQDARKTKAIKLADPQTATIDPATRTMIHVAQQKGVETVFDRAVNMKPCNIGTQGTCCKNRGMGPCRLPLPKGGVEGEDERKGLRLSMVYWRLFVRVQAFILRAGSHAESILHNMHQDVAGFSPQHIPTIGLQYEYGITSLHLATLIAIEVKQRLDPGRREVRPGCWAFTPAP